MIVIHKFEYDNVIKTYDCKSYACEIFLSRNTMLIGQIKFHKTTDQYIVLIWINCIFLFIFIIIMHCIE